MIAALVAVASWQDYAARATLDTLLRRYRQSVQFECRIEYQSTRTPSDDRKGTQDQALLYFEKSNDTYSVRSLSESEQRVFRASSTTARVDPYLVYDHHLTFLLGLRRSSLIDQLVDSKPARYTIVEMQDRLAVVQQYDDNRNPPFQTTFIIDKTRQLIESVSVCGRIGPTTDKAATTVLWTESVLFKNQTLRP